MNYTTEIIYHFTCDFCNNWWSYAASTELRYIEEKKWSCPHCKQENKPPHHNKLKEVISELTENLRV